MSGESYLEIIGRCGGRREILGRRERWRIAQRWRETFAVGLHAAKDRWKLGGFEWHVFSFGYARALNGTRAIAEYRAQQPPSFIVCPESELLPAMRIAGGELPDFVTVEEDLGVWPEDLAWTMAFTHERDWGLGPYFSRSEWIIRPTPVPDALSSR